MLDSARQGYVYQDILGAYLVAREIANGRGKTKFHFDQEKTPEGIPDKFDDLAIYLDGHRTFVQVKYSGGEDRHKLTKQDFSARGGPGLALYDLFETWKAIRASDISWRVCLAWDKPVPGDEILAVINEIDDHENLVPGTTSYQFDCDDLWPENGEVLSSWRALRDRAESIKRDEFKQFLESLIIEVDLPRSNLLQDYSQHLEKLLKQAIEQIGVGIYPNDHLSVRQVAESLCTIAMRRRTTTSLQPISCDEIAKEVKIVQAYGGIEQKFPVDKSVLVATPERAEQVISMLEEHRAVLLTAEPGAGKSWFIETLQEQISESTQVIKHYCYIALKDPLAIRRITVNVLYGNLITQILENNEELGQILPKRYASNLQQLNLLLKQISKKTLLIVDGLDHIWRVYQKNRGGLTEDETEIIQALAELDHSNPYVSILVVSQPIEQLEKLNAFSQCSLTQLPERFVEELLAKHEIQNIAFGDVSLAQKIHDKSNGNALYCKYLVDHALINRLQNSITWIDNLPPYDFNLTSYYSFLYEQIEGDASVPHALCGADFSLTARELQEITHLGSMVSRQINSLRPILKYKTAIGYSIYHESFKRYIVDEIEKEGASINQLIYGPLINWLEAQPFFESTKAYGHLLKLYFEIDALDLIAQTISFDFIEKSLFHSQPFSSIEENHNLQRAALQQTNGFAPMLIIAEQAKIIIQIRDNIADQVLVDYLTAVQNIHGDDVMYRVLWDGEKLLVSENDVLRLLVDQAYQGREVVHWGIVPSLSSIPYEILGFVCVKLIHTGQYEEFDSLIQEIYQDPEHQNAYYRIQKELDWLKIYIGDDWVKRAPFYQGIQLPFNPSFPNLIDAIEHIVSREKFIYDDDWENVIRSIVAFAKKANGEELQAAIDALSNYNWFRNWLIYLIKITALSQKDIDSEDIIEAFSYLVRDLEPFKGTPRACDLFEQLPFIKKSFHQGLQLCEGDAKLLSQCCDLLEKVTELTTSLQRSVSGPLTDEEFLDLISRYLPGQDVLDKFEEYYGPLGSRRFYSDVASIAFKYACALSTAGKNEEAEKKFSEGIQALSAYGFRKDRTLSEILYSSVPYQQAYGTLDVEWFYGLYHMSMTVVTHTDGRSTSSYPIEWFKEFSKIYPEEALRFLISETLENSEANWHQEDEFYFILEECTELFSPTQWFLLCRSLPLASSNKIVTHGLDVLEQIDHELTDTYLRWLKTRPFLGVTSDIDENYSPDVASRFYKVFGIRIEVEDEKGSDAASFQSSLNSNPPPLQASSVDEALAYFEAHDFAEDNVDQFQALIGSISDMVEKKRILRQAAKSFPPGSEIGAWVESIFVPGSWEWLYFQVSLFVYLQDGWYTGLNETEYLEKAYKVSPDETISMLKDILSQYIPTISYPMSISLNLIVALSKLKVDESLVQTLLNTVFYIVKRRLPYPPNSEINASIYQGIDGFNIDEIVVSLLIARLKTLTTEKTQGIVWGLTYLAKTKPNCLFKPYIWAFSNQSYLLPIHRALLLQILVEHVDRSMIPDSLVAKLLSIYPTGLFLEDQYIRSFVDYRLELEEDSARHIFFESHEYDKGFFQYIHPKYQTLSNHIGTLSGTFKAYEYQRDKLNKEHNSYHIQSDGVITPIVTHANTAYEIVNSKYYGELKALVSQYDPSYCCNLRFLLEEIALQVGSLSRRPSNLPVPSDFPLLEDRNANSKLEHEGLVVLASSENEYYGERFESKSRRNASLVFRANDSPENPGYYARYRFATVLYEDSNVEFAPRDQPICRLSVFDTLEQSSIIFLFPYVLRELNLRIDWNLHNGFRAINASGEEIIKYIVWKEDYYGDISDGTEVPRLEGAAVVMRDDYFERLKHLYGNGCGFILRKTDPSS